MFYYNGYLCRNKYLTAMSIHINFNLDHPYFREPLQVKVEWKCPFLPRIGESVNAWIWIEETEISKEKVESLLTAEGEKSYNSEIYKNYTLDDWLYEVGMECHVIYDMAYYKEEAEPYDIFVQMYLNGTGMCYGRVYGEE